MSGYEALLEMLKDPHRAEVRRTWEAVVDGELDAEQQADAAKIGPIVDSYLSGEIERDEYERKLAEAADAAS